MLSPLILPLTCIIATTLYSCAYIGTVHAIALIAVPAGILWYGQHLSGMLIVCCILLSSISYWRLHKLQTQFIEAQSITHTPISGYGHVTDITPQVQQQRPMATIELYPQLHQPGFRCRIKLPLHWDIHVGDIVHIRKLTIPEVTNQSFAWYLTRHELSGFIHKAPYMQVIHRPSWSLQRTLCDLRNRLITYMYHNMPPEHADIATHIFFGYKATSTQTRDQFQQWGISHLLARSGLHLVIFTSCCAWLMCVLPCHYAIRYTIIAIITGVYAAVSWPTISSIRALAMLYAFYICRSLRIRYQALHWVVCIAVLTLCWNPLHLFFLDFQLSFSLTFTLCWFFTHVVPRYTHNTLA